MKFWGENENNVIVPHTVTMYPPWLEIRNLFVWGWELLLMVWSFYFYWKQRELISLKVIYLSFYFKSVPVTLCLHILNLHGLDNHWCVLCCKQAQYFRDLPSSILNTAKERLVQLSEGSVALADYLVNSPAMQWLVSTNFDCSYT